MNLVFMQPIEFEKIWYLVLLSLVLKKYTINITIYLIRIYNKYITHTQAANESINQIVSIHTTGRNKH